jgi:similar to stage IV sporulation protein
MILIRVWHYIVGFVVVRVEGEWLERFLNHLIGEGIYAWDVTRRAGALYAKMGIAGFRRLRPVARKTRCRVRIQRKAGLPFWLARFKGRLALLGGILFFIVASYLATSFVWLVRVTGAATTSPEHILDVARRTGLYPGAWKRSVDLPDVETSVVLGTKGLSWAKVRVQGTVYTIEVIEKAPEPAVEVEGPCDIVASRDGTIERLLVLMGEARVKEGSQVSRGQVLVSGAIYSYIAPSTPGGSPQAHVAKYLRARAIVKARIPYSAYQEVPLKRTVLEPTGKARAAIMVRIGRTQIMLKFPGTSFEYWQVDSRSLLPWLGRNSSAFIEVHKLEIRELALREVTLSAAEAKSVAQGAATEAASSAIPAGAERADIRSIVTELPGAVGVRVTIDTIQDIGVAKPVTGR